MMPEVLEQWGGAAEAAWQAVQAEIKAKMTELNSQPGALEAFKGFVAAVDWTEPWIASLLTFHVLLLTTVVLQRRSQTVTGFILFLAVGLVWNAERLNALAGRHWRRFARQNYFDDHGIFTGVVLGAPLLLIMFVTLLIYLWQMSVLLLKMKRTELRAKARQRTAEQRQAASGSGSGSSSVIAGSGKDKHS